MRAILSVAVMVPLMLVAGSALGQDEEAEAESYVYATYFICDVSRQEQADEIVKTKNAPVYNAAVENGTITGWGWLAHHTGGKWRRIQYHSASSMEALFAAQNKIQSAMEEAGVDNSEFGSICNMHEDYVWKGVAGSGGNLLATSRGKFGLSDYHICKMSKESDADELVKNVFAPVYNDPPGRGQTEFMGLVRAHRRWEVSPTGDDDSRRCADAAEDAGEYFRGTAG